MHSAASRNGNHYGVLRQLYLGQTFPLTGATRLDHNFDKLYVCHFAKRHTVPDVLGPLLSQEPHVICPQDIAPADKSDQFLLIVAGDNRESGKIPGRHFTYGRPRGFVREDCDGIRCRHVADHKIPYSDTIFGKCPFHVLEGDYAVQVFVTFHDRETLKMSLLKRGKELGYGLVFSNRNRGLIHDLFYMDTLHDIKVSSLFKVDPPLSQFQGIDGVRM